MNNIIVLGYGQLGSEIIKQTKWDYLSREKNQFDFCNINSYSFYLDYYDIIINCIANTNTYSDNKKDHWGVNYKAVVDLVDFCNRDKKKIVHLSTDYIYANSLKDASEEDVPANCPNWYTYTKLLADGYIQLKANDYLLIRTSFKPYPFPYPKAITTQIGNFDYTNIIAKLIIELINKNASGIYNVGTEKKSIYDLAKKSNPNIEPSNIVLSETMPTDVSMNISKMEKFLKE
jgi:dTDP-4-dehydrorhamnose reductase